MTNSLFKLVSLPDMRSVSDTFQSIFDIFSSRLKRITPPLEPGETVTVPSMTDLSELLLDFGEALIDNKDKISAHIFNQYLDILNSLEDTQRLISDVSPDCYIGNRYFFSNTTITERMDRIKTDSMALVSIENPQIEKVSDLLNQLRITVLEKRRERFSPQYFRYSVYHLENPRRLLSQFLNLILLQRQDVCLIDAEKVLDCSAAGPIFMLTPPMLIKDLEVRAHTLLLWHNLVPGFDAFEDTYEGCIEKAQLIQWVKEQTHFDLALEKSKREECILALRPNIQPIIEDAYRYLDGLEKDHFQEFDLEFRKKYSELSTSEAVGHFAWKKVQRYGAMLSESPISYGDFATNTIGIVTELHSYINLLSYSPLRILTAIVSLPHILNSFSEDLSVPWASIFDVLSPFTPITPGLQDYVSKLHTCIQNWINGVDFDSTLLQPTPENIIFFKSMNKLISNHLGKGMYYFQNDPQYGGATIGDNVEIIVLNPDKILGDLDISRGLNAFAWLHNILGLLRNHAGKLSELESRYIPASIRSSRDPKLNWRDILTLQFAFSQMDTLDFDASAEFMRKGLRQEQNRVQKILNRIHTFCSRVDRSDSHSNPIYWISSLSGYDSGSQLGRYAADGIIEWAEFNGHDVPLIVRDVARTSLSFIGGMGMTSLTIGPLVPGLNFGSSAALAIRASSGGLIGAFLGKKNGHNERLGALLGAGIYGVTGILAGLNGLPSSLATSVEYGPALISAALTVDDLSSDSLLLPSMAAAGIGAALLSTPYGRPFLGAAKTAAFTSSLSLHADKGAKRSSALISSVAGAGVGYVLPGLDFGPMDLGYATHLGLNFLHSAVNYRLPSMLSQYVSGTSYYPNIFRDHSFSLLARFATFDHSNQSFLSSISKLFASQTIQSGLIAGGRHLRFPFLDGAPVINPDIDRAIAGLLPYGLSQISYGLGDRLIDGQLPVLLWDIRTQAQAGLSQSWDVVSNGF